MVATAFSAALAYGVLGVAGEISWTSAPAGSAGQTTAVGEISWTSTPAGTVVRAADGEMTTEEISWTVAPKAASGDAGDIEWGSTPAGITA
ncbi:5'-nucleotidase [Streptomyces sp. NPDC059096]|uniref:5'-nucleotidase n=1 Tax=unclassified Streptomyces TaxID=2593676 RepID=UPI00367E0250